MKKQHRPQPPMLNVIVDDIEKRLTSIVTEEEQTGPMIQLGQKYALKKFLADSMLVKEGALVEPPFPIHWVADTTNNENSEDEVYGISHTSGESLESIGDPIQHPVQFYFYEMNGVACITTEEYRHVRSATDDYFEESDYKIKGRNIKHRVPLSKRHNKV